MTKQTKTENTVWHHATITRNLRQKSNRHRSVVLWFTGLSGSGKSTLAHCVEERLFQMGAKTYVLDGDNVRHGLCGDLGFSIEDRKENIRRIAEISKLMLESGVITLTAFISPFINEREKARKIFPHGDFLEIFCDCPIEICEDRDVKGLYKRARAGEVKEFTGISSPYEEPTNPELVIKTAESSLQECTDHVIKFLINRDIFLYSDAPDSVGGLKTPTTKQIKTKVINNSLD